MELIIYNQQINNNKYILCDKGHKEKRQSVLIENYLARLLKERLWWIEKPAMWPAARTLKKEELMWRLPNKENLNTYQASEAYVKSEIRKAGEGKIEELASSQITHWRALSDVLRVNFIQRAMKSYQSL